MRPDQCCYDRKVLPLRRAVVGYDAWISAIRADQTKDRAKAGVVQWDAKFGLVKVNPLLSWTKKDVWNFIHKHKLQELIYIVTCRTSSQFFCFWYPVFGPVD